MIRSRIVRTLAALLCLGGCVSGGSTAGPTGILQGRVLVEWNREDAFIYRRTANALSFQPSFLTVPIVPEDMYTDGGSVPRILWGVPGLSPWGLGPAYIIHDWLFEVHRCGRDAPPEVKAITFEQSADILEEVARSLAAAGLMRNDRTEAVVLAVRSRYARDIWDRPAGKDDCAVPPFPDVEKSLDARRSVARPAVIDFTIPSPAASP
ncbi:DUF1353 domain-containing protein [Methylobrevis pamukkalensis]|uniref:DUF1353 domain-containing protein n=1 Tax=Methylobrevis pamukkalensis TaxID=1439726 RepID=A0A1E3H6A1_9HYPH|nr:DUF1353 domain-containing protein [Methylobrevis pamukkalensis]ODN71868.1 hypothetical protein A6302_00800 [Methylobrevis pamukkalensis]